MGINSMTICGTRRWIDFNTTVLFAAFLVVNTNGLVFAQALPGQIDQFAGSNCTISVTDKLPPDAISVVWRLMTEHRTLAQGTAQWKQSDLGPQFTFSTPELNAGVILDAELQYDIGDGLPGQRLALRIHDRDPLASIQQTLAEAGVALWDPVGATEKAFETLSFQPRKVSSLRTIGDERIVMVGEATTWDKPLITELERLAQNGKWVIVLRGADGSVWPISLSGRSSAEWAVNQLKHNPWWPAKLDTDFWAAGVHSALGWSLDIRRQNVVLTPSSGVDVWQLGKFSSLHDHGGICFIGVSLMQHWDTSPVPREFLSHLFVQLLQTQTPN